MMSVTPRTDAEFDRFNPGNPKPYFHSMTALCRRLELELSEAKQNFETAVRGSFEASQVMAVENAALRKEVARVKEELNWQSNRNSGHPTKGGYEFYINEEWTGLAAAALDADYGWCAALRKHRIDPDDERVRIRRVVEDDQILNQLAAISVNQNTNKT